MLDTPGGFKESPATLVKDAGNCKGWAARSAAFCRVMDELQRLTRVAPVLSEPQPAEAVIEMQARVATHLQRFHEAVQHRIASSRAI